MKLANEEHIKLIDSVEEILNLLLKNLVPRICRKMELSFPYEDGTLYFTIYPKSEKCFELKTDNIYYCFHKMRKHFCTDISKYHSYYISVYNNIYIENLMFDITDQDEIMYAFVENWKYIEEQCNLALNEDEKIKEKIHSFSAYNVF